MQDKKTPDPAIEETHCPTESHHCHCKKVHDCPIMVHPDSRIQSLLADLSEEIARYDTASHSRTTLLLHSDYVTRGSFHSLTVNGFHSLTLHKEKKP